MIVAGIDLSLTGSGIARVSLDGIRLSLVGSKGSADATLVKRYERLADLRARLLAQLDGVDLAVVEQPAYHSFSGHAHDRSGLWWSVVSSLLSGGIRVVEVAPATLKKYATGKGNANKDLMVATMARRFPAEAVDDNNLADALALACVAARLAGCPIDGDLPKSRSAAWETILRKAGPTVAG